MPLECGSVGRAIAEIRSLVRSLRPDVVHSHWRAVLPYVAAFRRKTSIVHSVHTTSLAGPLTRCVYRVPHRLVAISNAVATDLEALGESERRRCRRVHNGVKIPDDDGSVRWELVPMCVAISD